MFPAADRRIPLLIGITGHRDIMPEDREETTGRVRAFFAMLQARFPNTPLRLFSGLAAGADQLVADVALALGIEIVPVLPKPKDAYLEDFAEDAAARAGFLRLLEHRTPVVLDFLTTTESGPDAPYAALGNFLAVRCQIMLALWDGNAPRDLGGTAFTVASKLDGRLDSDAALIDPIEPGLVFHLPVRRQRDPERPSVLRDEFLEGAETATVLEALREIDEYNAAARRHAPGATTADAAFETADQLAVLMQRRVRRSRLAIFGCLASLVLSYAIYSEYDHPFALLVVYFLSLLSGGAILSIARRANLEQRFLDYRTLAEALRIQAMWTRSGLNWSVADYYLRKHRLELRWIRFALRAFSSDAAIVRFLASRRISPGRRTVPMNEQSVRAWIEDQLAYFDTSSAMRSRRLTTLERAASALYALGVLAACGALAITYVPALVLFQHEVILLMGLLPALAGTIGAWIKQVALTEEAARARGMTALFTHALEAWERPENASLRAAIAEDLGKEALHENADWLALRRGRPIEAPLG